MVVDEHGVAADMLNFMQEFLDGEPLLPCQSCCRKHAKPHMRICCAAS